MWIYSYPCVRVRCFVPVSSHVDSEQVVHVPQLFQLQWRASLPVHDKVDIAEPKHALPPHPAGTL